MDEWLMLLPWVADGITTCICNCGRCYFLGGLDFIATRVVVVLADGIAKSAYFNLSSEMLCRTSSHMCGRWYLPIFLLRDGSLTLMYRASFMVLRRFWPSLPTISKLSMVTLWPEMVEWSWMGEGVLRCSFKPLWKVSCWLPNIFFLTIHPVAFISIYDPTLFPDGIFVFWGHERRFLMVSPPFKCTWTPYFLHVLLKFSLRPWWYGTTMWGWLILDCSGLVGLVPLLLFLLASSFVFFIWILLIIITSAMVWVQHLPSHTVVISNTVYMNILYYLAISSAAVSNLGKFTISNIYHNILDKFKY